MDYVVLARRPCKGAQVPRSPAPDPALATILKRAREDRGHTQEHTAYAAGLSVATLQKIENAQAAPSWDSVRRIAAALDLKLATLGAMIEAGESAG